jgi:DNA polymerase-1
MATAYLVDASPYIFRAYFSIPGSMKDSTGAQSNAVFGFATFLEKLIADEKPTHLAVAFDRSLTTSFRNEVYPAYKAQRELPPPELEAQLNACMEVSDAFGACTLVDERYEADDLIATVARRLERDGHAAVVVTGDKDLCQLVTERVTILDVVKNARLDAAGVVAKMGVRPEQIPDLLGLAGDAVDNIPGVKGVGPKTASALLAHFAGLDALYDRLDDVASLPVRGAKSVMEKLARGRNIAYLSRQLATVAYDAPAPEGLTPLVWRGPRHEKAGPLFERLAFKGLGGRIAKLNP